MDDEVRKQIFKEFKEMITTESVVGEPIHLGMQQSFLSLIFPLALARALTARPELAEQAAERSHRRLS